MKNDVNRMKVTDSMGSTILEGGWKLYKGHRVIDHALFHPKSDPMEQNEVLKSHPDQADRLRGIFKNWLETVSAKLPAHVDK